MIHTKGETMIPRPFRFGLMFFYVMCYGTPKGLHPEGKSVRLGPVKALKYAWTASS